jgi:hypothetical protein
MQAFFCLINSQQGLVYLPILSVNFPAPVSHYLSFIIDIATFDPLPVDIAYDWLNLWNF